MPEDDTEFRRWYGAWADVRPSDVPALPLLDEHQLAWLREWLGVVHPGHAWLQRL